MKRLINKSWITIFVLLIGIFCFLGSAQGAYIKFSHQFLETSVPADRSISYIVHSRYGKDGKDNVDVLWIDIPSMLNDVLQRSYFNPYGVELDVEGRPVKSISPIEVYFDIEFKYEPQDIDFRKACIIIDEINNDDGSFNGKPMTFQQLSMTEDPSEKYPVFDLRRTLAQNGGGIPLYTADGSPLNRIGLFPDAQAYAKGVFRFDRYLSDINDDKVTDIKDLSLLTEHWMQEGFALIGDLSGENGIPDGRVDLFDLGVMAEEWGVRFVEP